jgi:hypothetical protein
LSYDNHRVAELVAEIATREYLTCESGEILLAVAGEDAAYSINV